MHEVYKAQSMWKIIWQQNSQRNQYPCQSHRAPKSFVRDHEGHRKRSRTCKRGIVPMLGSNNLYCYSYFELLLLWKVIWGVLIHHPLEKDYRQQQATFHLLVSSSVSPLQLINSLRPSSLFVKRKTKYTWVQEHTLWEIKNSG